jgi:hypothetical protein
MREAVATKVRFNAKPKTVWDHLMFYEEIPARPPVLLRWLLPQPIRTEGDKTLVGARIRCTYSRGYLIKRIIAIERPHSLQFDVIEQCLGIERYALALSGSYQISAWGQVTDVVLVTKYQAYLRPRLLWRPLEEFLVHQLHSHILRALGAVLLSGNSAVHPGVARAFPQGANGREVLHVR